MRKNKKDFTKAEILILVEYLDESWLYNSIDEVVSKIFKWFTSWFDRNDEQKYYFEVNKIKKDDMKL